MGLSRKRQRELNKLKSQAEDLLQDQKDVLEHASKVVRDASRQAANFAREEVSPRVRETFDDRVKPAIASGVNATRSAASSTRDRLVDDVLPAVSTALGSALAVLEVAKNPQVRAALSKVSKATSKVSTTVVPVSKSAGPGRYILIGISVVALAGIAYAAWQTLRADDELWIDDEPETDEN